MKEKKYRVIVHFEGSIDYEVEAKNEDEAKKEAERLFGDESDAIISSEIADCGVCDCIEIENID